MAGAAEPAAQRGRIIVRVVDFNNDQGHARIGLFNHGEGFPLDSAKALTGTRVAVMNKEATAVFDSLPYGAYAVVAHHDANDNFKLDKNWLGIPIEQYGVSNNPRPRLGAPRWKDAKFILESDSVVVTIKLHF
jgi:uncharacterized protein (DUF2141 family)